MNNSTTNTPSIYRRLSDEELTATRERYADDGLFRAVDSIGTKLEISTPKFGLRAEEAYVYTLALLRKIARQDYGSWYKANEEWKAECSRLDRVLQEARDRLDRKEQEVAEYAECRRLADEYQEARDHVDRKALETLDFLKQMTGRPDLKEQELAGMGLYGRLLCEGVEAEGRRFHELQEAEHRHTREEREAVVRLRHELWDAERRPLRELWDAEYAACRRLTREPEEAESRLVVGIVFFLAVEATYSSTDDLYRRTRERLFIVNMCDKKAFEGRDELDSQIREMKVPKGWMDDFLVREEADPWAAFAASAASAASGTSAGDDEPLLSPTNTVFSPILFDSEEKLALAREAIRQSFAADGESASDGKFNPSVQADWYLVLRAVVEAGVTRRDARISDRDFLLQMLAWLPGLFLRKEGEPKEETVKRYAKSLSKERDRWVKGPGRTEVLIKDLNATARSRGYGMGKAQRLFIAAKGLKDRLVELKNDLRKGKGA